MEQQLKPDIYKIEQFTDAVTDTSVQYLESQIKSLNEKRKLTLWITGLATALEVYLLNQFSWKSVQGFNAVLFSTAGIAFLHNVLIALTTYRLTTDIVDLHVRQQDRYRHQRLLVLVALDRNTAFTQSIFQDNEKSDLVLKLQDLDYFNGKKEMENVYIKLGKKLVHLSDKSASWFLAIQVFASLILLLMS